MKTPQRMLALSFASLIPVLAACGRTPPGPPDAAAPPPAATRPAATPARAPAVPAIERPAATIPSSFSCAGVDPQWSLQLSSRAGRLQLPEGESMFDGTLKATATGAYAWLGMPPAGSGAAPDATVALLVLPGHCFPADGGGALPYSAQLSLPDGRQAGGCCRPGR